MLEWSWVTETPAKPLDPARMNPRIFGSLLCPTQKSTGLGVAMLTVEHSSHSDYRLKALCTVGIICNKTVYGASFSLYVQKG